MTVLRSLAFQGLFYLWTVVLGIALLPILVAPRAWLIAAARVWTGGTLWLLRRIVGLDHQVRGSAEVPDGPVVFAFKHQSAWDTLVLNLLIRDPAIVIKRELLRVPLFGWYLWKADMIAVDRSAGAAALRRMMTAARRLCASGRPIVAFPEGTRTAVGAAPRYHPGVFALYDALGVPVVPVALNSGLFWGRREFVKRPGRITVEFLPPIPPGLGRREFMARLENSIETATEALVAAVRRSEPVTAA